MAAGRALQLDRKKWKYATGSQHSRWKGSVAERINSANGMLLLLKLANSKMETFIPSKISVLLNCILFFRKAEFKTY